MTVEERRTTLSALWHAVRTLVPSRGHVALDELYVAIEATYNDHGDERTLEAYAEGRTDGEASLEAKCEVAFRDGMLAVKKRSDFRDLDTIGDPEELRQIH